MYYANKVKVMKNKAFITPIIIILLTFTLILFNIPNLKTQAQPETTLYINPQVAVPTINETFSVNLTVANVEDLCSWQAYIYYKNDILETTGYAEGPFLKSHGPTMFDAGYNNNYNETHGQIWMYCVRTWSGTGVNGSGTLAIITFKAKIGGTTTLHLTDTILGNSSAKRIPHTPIDGTVKVLAADITILNITPSKTIVGQGYTTTINVTAKNQGVTTETFNLTLYANETTIQTQTITLTNGSSTTITFLWNTTTFAKGNYIITAYAHPTPYETNTTNNALTNGFIVVAYPGDVNVDRKVDMKDIAAIAKAFGSEPRQPLYNPNYDINDDKKINMKDIAIAAKNFGFIDP